MRSAAMPASSEAFAARTHTLGLPNADRPGTPAAALAMPHAPAAIGSPAAARTPAPAQWLLGDRHGLAAAMTCVQASSPRPFRRATPMPCRRTGLPAFTKDTIFVI